jgi:DNA-binding LacI/PurR family transcriptional regulator
MHLSKMLSALGEPYKSRFDIVYLDFNPTQFETLTPEKHPTYMMQDSYKIGAEAIKLMQSALRGEDISNEKIIVPSSIVIGSDHLQ